MNQIKSKLLFLITILIFLSTTCCACAAENQTHENLTSDVGSFTDLASEISQTTTNITLTRDYAFSSGDDTLGILISQPFYTLDGGGHTIDGKNQAIVFRIDGKNVTIKNLNFIDAKTGSEGGSVSFNKPGGVINNCNFTKCHAVSFYGGAVYFENDGRVTNSNFIENDGLFYGGGVYFKSDGYVEDCSFSNNTIGYFGSAIYCQGRATLNNVIFEANRAGEGAVYLKSGGVINRAVFKNNYANDGGGIYTCGKTLINNSEFEKNKALKGRGGGIYSEADLYLENCNFKDNDADKEYENVYIDPTMELTLVNVTPQRLIVTSFSVLYSEIFSGPYQTRLVKDYEYKPKYDSHLKRGIQITRSIVIDGAGHTIDARGLAAIFVVNSTGVVFKNINFINAKSSGNGGAVNFDCDVGILEGCTFINCTANTGAGAYFKENGNVTGCTFINNTANNGGAINAVLTVTVKDCLFAGNSANEGGACYFSNYTDVSNCNFTENHADAAGGACFFYLNGKVEDCRFTGNFADNGGGCYIREGVEIRNCDFNSNSAFSKGGGLLYESSKAPEQCRFTSNTAGAGGAMYCSENMAIDANTFTGNFAAENGGAIFFEKNGEVKNAEFDKNRAGLNGGAIYGNGLTKVSSMQLNYNKAQNGGALYIKDTAQIARVTFYDNFAENGGAIYFSTSATVDNLIFLANNATNGGAIYFHDEGTLKNSTFSGNTAVNGGAVYFNSNGMVENTQFVKNTAVDGGAMYFTGNATLKNATFDNDHAERGAGTYFEGNEDNPTFAISESYFYRETVYGDGGAIYSERMGTIDSTTFDINHADGSGGAICTLENMTIKNSVFIANTAGDGTNQVNIKGKKYVFLDNVTPERIGPYKSVCLEIVSVENSTYRGIVKITVRVTSDEPVNDGNASVIINDTPYFADVENGMAVIEITGPDVGIYTSNVTFNGGERYGNASREVTFKVAVENATISVNYVANCTYGGEVVIVVTVLGSEIPVTNGTGYLKVGDRTYNVTTTNGILRFTLKGLDAGEYVSTLTFDGGINHNTPTVDIPFSVTPILVDLVVNATDVIYSDILEIHANVTSYGKPVNEGTVYMILNGKNYTADVTGGSAIIKIERLDAGHYWGNVVYENGVNYAKPARIVSFDVFRQNATIISMTQDCEYGGSVIVKVFVIGDWTTVRDGVIYLISDNFTCNATVENAAAELAIANLDAGFYRATLVLDSRNYNATPQNVTFKVERATPEVSITAADAVYGSTVKIIVTAKTGYGAVKSANVTVDFNGRTYLANLENGSATVKIGNLDVGEYVGNVTCIGGANYNNITEKFAFNVVKKTADITASDKAYVINYGGKYSVTVRGVAGAKVTFTLNGKNIGYGITNANGVATITITAKMLKAAKAGKKNLLIKLESANYQGTKTVRITVNKEKTKIAAKKKTFKKSQKVKRYSITLKNSKNKAVKKVKVSLKVKGKTYWAKTNSKGKATFKIKKLNKKGTFKAKVTFKGNNYYKKATKTVKIKIR